MSRLVSVVGALTIALVVAFVVAMAVNVGFLVALLGFLPAEVMAILQPRHATTFGIAAFVVTLGVIWG